MKVFNKDVIINFARHGNETIANGTIDHVSNVVYAALSDMAKTNPFIDAETLEFYLVNEFVTGAYCPFSELKLYASMLSPQLEFNTIKISDNPFKRFRNRLVFVWKNRKRKRNKKIKSNNTSVLINEGKYNMDRFLEDLQDAIVQHILNTSLAVLVDDGIKLFGRDEFGFKVKVIPVLRNGETLKVYDSSKRLFKETNFGDRITNLIEKSSKTGENFTSILRIFNSLYYNLYHIYLDQIFIESVIQSVPDSLFTGNVYDAFIKVLNYISLNDLSRIVSITDKNKKLFIEEPLCTISYYESQKFFRDISSKI